MILVFWMLSFQPLVYLMSINPQHWTYIKSVFSVFEQEATMISRPWSFWKIKISSQSIYKMVIKHINFLRKYNS